MSEFEEPVPAGAVPGFAAEENRESSPLDQIRELMTEQPYGVLCTQGDGQPYGSLIAFAANRDLNMVVFATPVGTRKFRLLCECSRVALVVDNRTDCPDKLSRIHALTATGKAVRLNEEESTGDWQKLLVGKHPLMHDFIHAPGTALIRIDILRYTHVSRLQEVFQWTPPRSS